MPHLVAVLGALAIPLAAGSPGDGDPVERTVDFARDVRPILSDNCFQCHGPDPATREAGLRLDTKEGALGPLKSGGHAIVGGDLDESELIYRLDPDFETDLMPPESSGKSLTDEERATLRLWIQQGAAWDEHWSFVPPVRTEPPTVDATADAAPIDAFLADRLSAAGLSMRPEAEPATLLRRVTLDLTGLPPSADERAAFAADVDARGVDAAYRDAVQRLLASDRYGVHMARPWLDAARYADTHGLHLDNLRSMWPYRDWVVDALNANKPYDEFVVEQLAGDLLPDATLEQRIASGFNRCNPTSAEGGMIAQEYLSIYAKDRVDTTATVFLGLTLACAQCHDHKFDPLSQRDYYAMYAFFNSLSEEATDRNIQNPVPFVRVPTADLAARVDELAREETLLSALLDRPDPALEAREAAWLDATAEATRRSWNVLVPETASATGGAELSIDGTNGIVTASGENPAKTTYTIDAWVPPGSIGGLRLDALVLDGQTLPGRATNENFVLTSVEVLAAPSGERDALRPVPLAAAAATHSQGGWPIENTLDPATTNGWAGLGKTGDRSAIFLPTRAFGGPDGTELRVVLRFDSVHVAHAFARFRLAVRRTADEGPSIRTGTWSLASFHVDSSRGLFARDFGPEAGLEDGIDLASEAAPGVAWAEHPEYVEGSTHRLPGGVGSHYLVQRIESDARRSIELRLGSDDGIVVWLRGEKILSNNVARGVALDQERLVIDLEPGVNELVLKVVNTGGPGAFAWRFVDTTTEAGLTPALELALQGPQESWTDAERTEARVHWRRAFAPAWAEAFEARIAAREERATVEASFPTTMVSEELMDRRTAHVLMRGAYDKQGEAVGPGTPSVLPPLPADAPQNRLGLARWLVSGDNPLTARVWVNRAWQQFFGLGLVATPEDFGAQGAWPTHPELLDWLALEFVASGWDMKAMHERIVTSRAYRQSSRISGDLLESDPENALLARGPRFRLDGEVLRDQALLLAGLLDETMGGPGVRPYQPEGVWFAVGYSGSNTVRYAQGPREHLHRRSLYTFWKRTAPPPNLTTFDAPMRDACVVRRERTNTPLQALVMLNDPTFVEAARFVAARVLDQGGSTTTDRAAFLFEHVVGRAADADELERVVALATDLTAAYEEAPDEAVALVAVGDLPVPIGPDVIELAAWTLAASAVLNLDEVLTRN
ncbi:MAG: PSD1 and planctomycete cytochrome C domain-containing protein [Planctomycetota bacterium]